MRVWLEILRERHPGVTWLAVPIDDDRQIRLSTCAPPPVRNLLEPERTPS